MKFIPYNVHLNFAEREFARTKTKMKSATWTKKKNQKQNLLMFDENNPDKQIANLKINLGQGQDPVVEDDQHKLGISIWGKDLRDRNDAIQTQQNFELHFLLSNKIQELIANYKFNSTRLLSANFEKTFIRNANPIALEIANDYRAQYRPHGLILSNLLTAEIYYVAVGYVLDWKIDSSREITFSSGANSFMSLTRELVEGVGSTPGMELNLEIRNGISFKDMELFKKVYAAQLYRKLPILFSFSEEEKNYTAGRDHIFGFIDKIENLTFQSSIRKEEKTKYSLNLRIVEVF